MRSWANNKLPLCVFLRCYTEVVFIEDVLVFVGDEECYVVGYEAVGSF